MSRYIDAEELHNITKNMVEESESSERIIRIVDALLDACTTVKMQPQTFSHWKPYSPHLLRDSWECSNCGYKTFNKKDVSRFNYCPVCGSKMVKPNV